MADQSVVSGGGGTSHDNLEPELEIVDAAAMRTADAQSRRYAHTMRRGVTTPALGTRSKPIATPADGTLPEDRDATSVSAKLPRPTPRDSATAPPRFVADHRDSAPLAAPRF